MASAKVTTNGAVPEKDQANDRAKKYSELETDNRKQATVIRQVRKEKDSLQQDYNKAVLAKAQLEKLCRELQKQNKAINEESLVKLKEEEERRKETQASFQKQINDIMGMIKDNKESNEKLQEDKVKMSQHFKYLVEQTQCKQQEIEKIDKQMELAMQLSDAKLAKAQMEAAIEKEAMLKEKHDMLTELKKCRQDLGDQQAREKIMQDQLNLYTEKYQEFQTSFAKSNDIFGTYKREMEKMSKKIVKLEKESVSWKLRFEKSNVALLDLASEKQVRDQILCKTTRQLAQLQKLCRTFQAERSVLIKALQDNNIDVPPTPQVPDEPLPELPQLSFNDDKLNAMTKNCSELKENLAKLQSQLDASEKEEPQSAVNPKKSKSKNKKKSKVESPPEVAQNEDNVNGDNHAVVEATATEMEQQGPATSTEETSEEGPITAADPTTEESAEAVPTAVPTNAAETAVDLNE